MPTTPRIYIGVDVGGTSIRAAAFNNSNHIPEHKTKQPTLAAEGPEAVTRRIAMAIRDVAPNMDQVAGIGLALPGPIDPYQGVIYSAPNLPGFDNLPIRKIMEKLLDRPVFVGNDANVAALGEWKFGGGRGHNDVLYLTISTGIGGGVVTGGRLLVGANGLGAELGHIHIAPDGPLCGCGQHGHLEAMASGTAIARNAANKLQAGEGATSKLHELTHGDVSKVTTALVGEAALQGDDFAKQLITDAATLIGRTTADYLHIFNPSIIVIGGGVSFVGDLLLTPLRDAMRRYSFSEAYWKNCPVVPAELGDDCGMVGAAVLAMEEAK